MGRREVARPVWGLYGSGARPYRLGHRKGGELAKFACNFAMARRLLLSRAMPRLAAKETTMMKRLMTSAAAALLIGLPALASEGGAEAAHDALTEGAPAAAEVNMPDEADGPNNDGQHQKVEEGQAGFQGEHGDDKDDKNEIHEAEGDHNHGGEAGSIETVGTADEGAGGKSGTNGEGNH